jgi:hypothetical protein
MKKENCPSKTEATEYMQLLKIHSLATSICKKLKRRAQHQIQDNGFL